MPEKEIKAIEQDSEIWNIAKGFTNFSVLALLVEINNLIKIARFGCERVSEKAFLPQSQLLDNRLEAIYRIEDNLRQIYENTYFIMKNKNKENMDKIKEKLDYVKEKMDAMTTTFTNPNTREDYDQIDEKHFALCLKVLRDLKRDMHTPLNNVQLIFPKTEELDFKKMEDDLIFGG